MQYLHLIELLGEKEAQLSTEVPPEPQSIDDGAHGTENLLLKTQETEDFA